MARVKKNPSEVRKDEPEITKAKVKVAIRALEDKLKAVDLPPDIEEIIKRYRASRTEMRHIRAEAKSAWNRAVDRCQHAFSINSKVKLPADWQAEGKERCKHCGLLKPAEAVVPVVEPPALTTLPDLPPMPVQFETKVEVKDDIVVTAPVAPTVKLPDPLMEAVGLGGFSGMPGED